MNTASGLALCVSATEVGGPVKAFFAPADPVAVRRAFLLHFLVLGAEVVAVQTPGQVVPQLRVMVTPALRALGGLGGGAVRGHVRARGTLGAGEVFPRERICVLKGGNGLRRPGTADGAREQEQHRWVELRKGPRLLLLQVLLLLLLLLLHLLQN